MLTPAAGRYNQPQNLAELLTVLDEFLRCRELPIAELLAKFLESRGSVHPTFHANNLIDHLSFHSPPPSTRNTLEHNIIRQTHSSENIFASRRWRRCASTPSPRRASTGWPRRRSGWAGPAPTCW